MTELNNLVHRVNIEFNTNNFLEDYEGHFMVDRQYDISGKFDFSMVEASADYEHDIRCDNCGYYLVYCWLREKVEPCFEGCNKVIPTIGKE